VDVPLRGDSRAIARPRVLAGALAAGGALLVATWALVDRGSAGLDRAAFDALATDRGSALARVVNVLSTIGPALLAALVLLVAADLVRRRRADLAAVVVGGSLATFLAVHVAKDAQQRPRPQGELVHAGGFSFPSTDAALSIAVLAVAVAIHRAAGGNDARRRLLPIAIAVILLIGVMLVTIRVHYVTDVVAGWGLGLAVFAGLGLLMHWLISPLLRKRSTPGR
jgi:undecaprenyl-diphosphatase